MPEPRSKPGAPKVFDVAKPGKSAPSASSKPIIVTNRPVLKDPMMVDESTDAGTKDKEPLTAPIRIKIQPLHHDDEPKDEPEKPAKDGVPTEPAEKSIEEPKATPKP